MNTEVLTPKVIDFIEIKDADTGEVLLRQRGQIDSVKHCNGASDNTAPE